MRGKEMKKKWNVWEKTEREYLRQMERVKGGEDTLPWCVTRSVEPAHNDFFVVTHLSLAFWTAEEDTAYPFGQLCSCRMTNSCTFYYTQKWGDGHTSVNLLLATRSGIDEKSSTWYTSNIKPISMRVIKMRVININNNNHNNNNEFLNSNSLALRKFNTYTK